MQLLTTQCTHIRTNSASSYLPAMLMGLIFSISGCAPKKPTPIAPPFYKVAKDSVEHPLSGGILVGAEKSPVVITVFLDMLSPDTSKLDTELARVFKTKKTQSQVSILYRQFPNNSLRKQSVHASLAFNAAASLNKLDEMKALILFRQSTFHENKMDQFARDAGLPVKAFQRAVSAPWNAAQLQADLILAQKFKLQSAPAVFINGQRTLEMSSTDVLKQIADEIENSNFIVKRKEATSESVRSHRLSSAEKHPLSHQVSQTIYNVFKMQHISVGAESPRVVLALIGDPKLSTFNRIQQGLKHQLNRNPAQIQLRTIQSSKVFGVYINGRLMPEKEMNDKLISAVIAEELARTTGIDSNALLANLASIAVDLD